MINSKYGLAFLAEKAFNRKEWMYLFQNVGLGLSFINWVKLLYQNPKLAVVTNDRRSPFSVSGQTRSLSPIISVLILEILATVIKQYDNIVDKKAGSEEYKLLLYADDVVLLSRWPIITVLHILICFSCIGIQNKAR